MNTNESATMTPVETLTISPTEFVEIYNDPDPESPRNWDNVGTMVCWHRRYNLGDKHNYSCPQDFKDDIPPDSLVLPLYLYDHSGITMSASKFSCPWDSGQVGYIYCTPEKIQKEFGDFLTDSRIKAKHCLLSEVEVYDWYLQGQVFGYKHFRKPDDGPSYYDFVNDEDWRHDDMDSCWGFYGSDWKTNGILDHIPSLSKLL